MGTDAPMATPTDADILTLSQLLSPAYPVGAFAYSHGLEWAIESGSVRDAMQAKAWIADVLVYGSGWTDAVLATAGHGAATPDELSDIDNTARAFCASSERLKETDLLGAAYCDTTNAVWGLGLPALTYPVAIGRSARLLNLPLTLTAQMAAQAFMANLVACAMRLVPLGQTDGQRIIRDLTPTCRHIADQAQTAKLDDIASNSFLPDIASMAHETLYTRIFRT